MRDADHGGYIALLAVLIVGAVSAAIGLALLMAGADGQRGALIMQRSLQARAVAHTCAEEALQDIHDNVFYTGTVNLFGIGLGTCTYTITNTGGNNRSIAVSAGVNSVVRRVQVYATIGTSSISITSWKEVN